jgi:hypothetical protein
MIDLRCERKGIIHVSLSKSRDNWRRSESLDLPSLPVPPDLTGAMLVCLTQNGMGPHRSSIFFLALNQRLRGWTAVLDHRTERARRAGAVTRLKAHAMIA